MSWNRLLARLILIATILIAIGAIRMATTFRVFAATSDEAATHIGAGSAARREHMEKLTVSLMGPADYVALGFLPVEPASPWTESHGWVAVSDHSYQLSGAEGGWRWLPETYERVGKSIRLYRIP